MNCRKFPKFPYRGGKFSKVGNYCGNLSLPSGNLLVLDLVTLPAASCLSAMAAALEVC